MSKELRFDCGQKQQIVITSQLPLDPSWNLKPSYVLVTEGFPAEVREAAA